MPPKRKITLSEMIQLFNEYIDANPEKKFKYSEFGNFVRSRGYNLADKSIRRWTDFREYVSKYEESWKSISADPAAVYHPMNIDKFIKTNNTEDKMRNALSVINEYNQRISLACIDTVRKNKNLLEENNKLKARKQEFDTAMKENQELKRQNREYKEQINILKSTLKKNVYPEVAHSILAKQGILKEKETSPVKEIRLFSGTDSIDDLSEEIRKNKSNNITDESNEKSEEDKLFDSLLDAFRID